jgi:ATP-dependent helicase/nuclease subunit A
MTRAADRLIVCGAEGERPRPAGCWWDLVKDALAPLSTEMNADDGDGKVWRYCKVAPIPSAPWSRSADTRVISAPPAWLNRDALPAPAGVVPLSPSHAYDESVPSRGTSRASGREREKALARGVLMHRLLQALPDMAADVRRDAARRHLARRADLFSAQECESMIEQVCRVLDDPRYSTLFGPGSYAELPIAGRFPGKGGIIAVSGQVDRLAVTADEVLIADFKTNHPAPAKLEEVPQAYVAQLALYRGALALLYPGKRLRAALLWTDIPALMEIPAERMDAALAALTSA